MGKRTEYPNGTFSWADLSTSDAGAAKAFYGGLFGWSFEDMPAGPDMIYTMATQDGETVAALFKGDGSLPVHWNNYVTVDDVDAATGAAEGAGASVVMAPFDVLDVGRQAIIADPTGAVLALWQAKSSPGATLVNVPGALTWNDLNTTDPAAAEAFYTELFGWEFTKLDIPDFDYWTIQNGGRSNGGMRPIDAQTQAGVPSHWLPYFATADVHEAEAKVKELGGQVHFGPLEIPNGGAFLVAGDPQGGVFALFAGEFDD
jgi:predicted enzyme related to lactoylglutathione lyase